MFDNHEIQAFWQATGALGFPFGPIFRLLLVTGQRRAEVSGLTQAELDLDHQIWTLPGQPTKNGKAHTIDLSPQALAYINTAPATNEILFSSNGHPAPSAFSKAKMKVDAPMAAVLCHAVPAWLVHDLRRTGATGMAGIEFLPYAVERMLKHACGSTDGLVVVSQRYEHQEQRRQAMLRWGSHLETLVSDDKRDRNVIALAPRRER